ncbi:unnamed protein product [Lactuca saligna]|uniref:peptidylprolyl isomerase n=1 Tax=Lactuca saligna TaxID=75948 RepID=A0AA35YN58_LACSI|nr:unnamed protein product [Lactuca saligna]
MGVLYKCRFIIFTKRAFLDSLIDITNNNSFHHNLWFLSDSTVTTSHHSTSLEPPPHCLRNSPEPPLHPPQVFQQTLKSRNQLSLYRFKSLGCRGYCRCFLFYYQLSQFSLLVLVVRRRGLPVAVTGVVVVFKSRKSIASSQFSFTAISSDQFSLRNVGHHHGPSHRRSPPPIVSTGQLTSIILNYDALKKKNASKRHHPRGQRVSFPDLLFDLLYIPWSLPSGIFICSYFQHIGDRRLIKRPIRDGKGEFHMACPLQDSRLRVHYKGMLLDEKKTVFYDTKANNDEEPLEFSFGEGLVPEGFEMCVRLMLPEEAK